MRKNRQSSRLRTVTLLVPEDFAEGFRQLAFEVRARQAVGKDGAKIGWHKLNRIAEILTDLECCGRCMVYDTGASGDARFHWAVTVFGDNQVAAGHTADLADARSQAEARLAAYVADLGEPPSISASGRGRWAMLNPQSRRLKTRRFSKPTMVSADRAAQLGGSGESLVKADGDQK